MHYEISDIRALLTEDEIESVLSRNVRTKRMRDAISVDSVLKLIEVYGGRRLYVPLESRSGHTLVSLLGQEQADKFSREFGGQERLSVPVGYELQHFAKKKEVLRHLDMGLTQFEVGKKFHISVRRVSYIVAENSGKKRPACSQTAAVAKPVKQKANWASSLSI